MALITPLHFFPCHHRIVFPCHHMDFASSSARGCGLGPYLRLDSLHGFVDDACCCFWLYPDAATLSTTLVARLCATAFAAFADFAVDTST